MRLLASQIFDWGACHICGGNQLDGGSVEIDGESAIQPITCLNCEATWDEVYQASSRENVMVSAELPPFDPFDHIGHKMDMTEGADTIWHINLDAENRVIEAYDYTTGDGDSNYMLHCYDCMKSGPLPPDVGLEF